MEDSWDYTRKGTYGEIKRNTYREPTHELDAVLATKADDVPSNQLDGEHDQEPFTKNLSGNPNRDLLENMTRDPRENPNKTLRDNPNRELRGKAHWVLRVDRLRNLWVTQRDTRGRRPTSVLRFAGQPMRPKAGDGQRTERQCSSVCSR